MNEDDNVVRFPSTGRADMQGHLQQRMTERTNSFRLYLPANQLAASLGSTDEWLASAVAYLRVAVGTKTGGSVEVPVSALLLLLACAETLEDAGMIDPAPKGAA